MTVFPTPLYTPTCEIPNLLYTQPTRIVHYMKSPPGQTVMNAFIFNFPVSSQIDSKRYLCVKTLFGMQSQMCITLFWERKGIFFYCFNREEFACFRFTWASVQSAVLSAAGIEYQIWKFMIMMPRFLPQLVFEINYINFAVTEIERKSENVTASFRQQNCSLYTVCKC